MTACPILSDGIREGISLRRKRRAAGAKGITEMMMPSGASRPLPPPKTGERAFPRSTHVRATVARTWRCPPRHLRYAYLTAPCQCLRGIVGEISRLGF